MKLYIFEGTGLWLHASYICIAESEEIACNEANQWASQNYCSDMRLIGLRGLDAGVVFTYNGDY